MREFSQLGLSCNSVHIELNSISQNLTNSMRALFTFVGLDTTPIVRLVGICPDQLYGLGNRLPHWIIINHLTLAPVEL